MTYADPVNIHQTHFFAMDAGRSSVVSGSLDSTGCIAVSLRSTSDGVEAISGIAPSRKLHHQLLDRAASSKLQRSAGRQRNGQYRHAAQQAVIQSIPSERVIGGGALG